MKKRYNIQLSYCDIDRLFFVRLYEYGKEIGEKYFQSEREAREFIESVTV